MSLIHSTDEHLSTLDGKGGFELLYERHAAHLLAYLTRSAGHSDAGDLAQEVWLKVHAALPKTFSSGTFKSWLFSIAKNKNIDHARKRPFAELKVDLADRSSDASESMLDTERVTRLRECLDELRAHNLRSAEVFTRLLQGCDVADIGTDLNLDAQQVYNIKNKTIPVLQECVSKERA
ncbi:MAG: sigma-70 family RNA polymerase sigma factor [Planctomycetota bacterium]